MASAPRTCNAISKLMGPSEAEFFISNAMDVTSVCSLTPRKVRAAVALQKQQEQPEEEEPEQLVPVPVQEATPSPPDRWCRC